MDSAAVYQASAKKSKTLSPSMKHEWEKLFERQLALLKKSRKAVEMVYMEKSEDASCIAKSKAGVADEKKQLE